METLTEIENKEHARRERARQYEALTNQRFGLRTEIERLSFAAIDLTALRRLRELANDVPATLTTRTQSIRGIALVPGGMVVRELLVTVLDGAVADAEARDDKRETALREAKRRLAEVETALKSL